MNKGVLNLSIEESVQLTRKFLKQMAQPFSKVSYKKTKMLNIFTKNFFLFM